MVGQYVLFGDEVQMNGEVTYVSAYR